MITTELQALDYGQVQLKPFQIHCKLLQLPSGENISMSTVNLFFLYIYRYDLSTEQFETRYRRRNR